MKSIFRFLAVLFIGSAGLLGCKNENSESAQFSKTIDTSPNVTLNAHKVNGHDLLHVTYSWKTGENFQSPSRPLRVKVHFSDNNGEVYWQDDHQPDPDVESWKPGEVYEYTRVVYVPLIPRITEIKCLVGLYDPINPRMIYNLNGELFQKDKYTVAALTVSPPRSPEDLPGSKISFEEGWYDLERNAVTKSQHRWMSGRGICELKNPERQAEFFCEGWIPTDQLDAASTVTVTIIGKSIIQKKTVTDEFSFYQAIPPEIFEEKDSAIMEITTDQTFIPADEGLGDDSRELGIMFKTLYFN